MALSSTRPESRFCLIPQPVFVAPHANSPKNGLEISHWLLTQKQLGEVNGKVDGLADNLVKAPVMVTNSQLDDDDVDDLTTGLVLLQTGGVIKEGREEQVTTPALDITESDEHSNQDASESDHAASPESPEEEQIFASPPTPLAHSRWLDIVAHYTRRKLTFETDILPALAGLAKQFHSSFDCDYYAGLWEDTFPVGPLWRSRDAKNHARPTEWRAPSWSWASTTAAVDHYHLLMAFELDSHTFRYSISHSFIDDIQVTCVPLNGDDPTMGLRSAKVTLTGALFELALAPVEEKLEEQAATPSKMTAEEIEGLRIVMERAICLPSPTIPEDDIRYSPLARCMDNTQEVSWLGARHGPQLHLEKEPDHGSAARPGLYGGIVGRTRMSRPRRLAS